MLINKDTYAIQSGLASYCRTNEEPNLPGVTKGRIQQYRRLVYNVIDDTFEGAFPITRKLLNDEEWHDLVNTFFINHACQTPSVWKLPFEFYEYVAFIDIISFRLLDHRDDTASCGVCFVFSYLSFLPLIS